MSKLSKPSFSKLEFWCTSRPKSLWFRKSTFEYLRWHAALHQCWGPQGPPGQGESLKCLNYQNGWGTRVFHLERFHMISWSFVLSPKLRGGVSKAEPAAELHAPVIHPASLVPRISVIEQRARTTPPWRIARCGFPTNNNTWWWWWWSYSSSNDPSIPISPLSQPGNLQPFQRDIPKASSGGSCAMLPCREAETTASSQAASRPSLKYCKCWTGRNCAGCWCCWFFDLEWELDLGDYPQPNFSDWWVIAIDSLGLGHCKRLARCWKLSQMVFPDTPRVKTGVPATLHKLPSLQSIAADSCHGALPESQWRVGWKSQRAEVRSNSCWQSCGKECQRWHVSQLSQIPKR